MFLFITVILFLMVIFGLLFAFQERLLFFPDKLKKDHQFYFAQDFEEIRIKATDGILLHGLLFKADSPKGLIFYLHGNAGAVDSWGGVAKTYTDLNYDVFVLDYRGYGKSEGSLSRESQLFEDVQTVYDKMKNTYPEEKIVVSVGTGPATRLAATNRPRLLILQAPFYSLTDAAKKVFPWFPSFLIKYRFDNYNDIKACTMPVVIFHGKQDEIINYEASLRLQNAFKPGDTLILLDRQGHNGITENREYKSKLVKILE